MVGSGIREKTSRIRNTVVTYRNTAVGVGFGEHIRNTFAKIHKKRKRPDFISISTLIFSHFPLMFSIRDRNCDSENSTQNTHQQIITKSTLSQLKYDRMVLWLLQNLGKLLRYISKLAAKILKQRPVLRIWITFMRIYIRFFTSMLIRIRSCLSSKTLKSSLGLETQAVLLTFHLLFILITYR
jgi:hypothetical protein